MPKKRIRSQSISDALKRAIKKSGLTSYMLAKRAGVTPPIIDRFKSGQRSLRLDSADKIAKVLGMTLVHKDEI